MDEQQDAVATYALSLGFKVAPRTVLVEGTTDVDLFELCDKLEFVATGQHLLQPSLAVAAPGSGDLGGTRGVVRELISLRAVARTCLQPNGRPRYRVVGLFDNDKAGRDAVKTIRSIDTSVLEFKDVFRLWPVMPLCANLDPIGMRKEFEDHNRVFKGLDWELEDLLPSDFVAAFLSNCPTAVVRHACGGGRTHRDFTPDGKAKFHRFIKENAVRADLVYVTETLKAMRVYLGLDKAMRAWDR